MDDQTLINIEQLIKQMLEINGSKLEADIQTENAAEIKKMLTNSK